MRLGVQRGARHHRSSASQRFLQPARFDQDHREIVVRVRAVGAQGQVLARHLFRFRQPAGVLEQLAQVAEGFGVARRAGGGDRHGVDRRPQPALQMRDGAKQLEAERMLRKALAQRARGVGGGLQMPGIEQGASRIDRRRVRRPGRVEPCGDRFDRRALQAVLAPDREQITRAVELARRDQGVEVGQPVALFGRVGLQGRGEVRQRVRQAPGLARQQRQAEVGAAMAGSRVRTP